MLDAIPAGRACSIEREIFPALAAGGSLYGFPSDAYWRDIGTPASYLAADHDVLRGALVTESPLPGRLPRARAPRRTRRAAVDALSSRSAPGARVGAGATVSGSVVGAGATRGRGRRARATRSWARASRSARARASAPGAVVGDGAVIAAGATVGADEPVPTGATAG